MSSPVEICNRALASIRAKSINALDQGTFEAQICTLYYEKARDKTLADYDWGFNNQVVALAKHASVTVFGWTYVYAYPTDCLHINFLRRNIDESGSIVQGVSASSNKIIEDSYSYRPSDHPPVEYEIYHDKATDAVVICSHEDNLRADIRARISSVKHFSLDFEMALSYLIASMIAVPIVGEQKGRALQQTNLALYTGLLGQAKAKSANQRERAEPDSEYITVRN